MNKHAAWMLLLPMVAWANELPPPKAQAIKAAESHAAPDTKAAKPAVVPASSAKAASKHAAPQQMAEPIKVLKPSTAPADAHSTPEVLKPSTPAVTRYVSPQFSAAQAAAQRPVVRSKAPTARSRSPSAKATVSYAMKPGLVRVLPAAQIPSSAILPPSKQIQWSESARVGSAPSPKANVVWGAIEPEEQNAPAVAKTLPEVVATPVAGRKMASPNYYSETNPEARWQYYSYP